MTRSRGFSATRVAPARTRTGRPIPRAASRFLIEFTSYTRESLPGKPSRPGNRTDGRRPHEDESQRYPKYRSVMERHPRLETLERLLRPERLDQVFEDVRRRQYSKQLLFSQVVAVMTAVATRTHASVHSAYLAVKDRLAVSAAALYAKLNHIEPETSSALIRQTAADAAVVIDAMAAAKKEVLPGLELFYLDGNHLAATEHRVAELRGTREGPLPGQALALLDAQRELIVDLVPCEDGHAQERSLLPELLERIRAGVVIVADRNFCTSRFFFGLTARQAFFVIRQHASTLTWKLRGRRRRVGRIATGMVYEQEMDLHSQGETLPVRRITLRLDRPTESGDTEVHIITNLSAEQATAQQVGAGVRDALDGGRCVPDLDRRAPLRGRDSGLPARGVVLVRDGRTGLQHVRRGEGVVAQRARAVPAPFDHRLGLTACSTCAGRALSIARRRSGKIAAGVRSRGG